MSAAADEQVQRLRESRRVPHEPGLESGRAGAGAAGEHELSATRSREPSTVDGAGNGRSGAVDLMRLAEPDHEPGPEPEIAP